MTKQTIPKKFLIFKIVGLALLVCAITVFILAVTTLKNGNMPNIASFIIGMFLLPCGIVLFYLGFLPNVAKTQVKMAKYIQQQTKQDLSDMASLNADINSQAITKMAQATKQGFADEIYCKYCGKQIDKDSVFCKHCGKQQ